MADSIREQIMKAAVAALNGPGRPAGVPAADRLRVETYTPSELPAICVLPVREDVLPMKDTRWGPLVERQMMLRVACYVGQDAPDQALDPILQWATVALDGLRPNGDQNAPFAGIVLDVIEAQLEWQFAPEELPYAVCFMDWRIYYTTERGDTTRAS